MAIDSSLGYATLFGNYIDGEFCKLYNLSCRILCISLLFVVFSIFLTTITSALTLTAPSSALVEENITVTIIDSNIENGDYDVKLFVEDNGVTISQIYSSGWKSSFYYLLGAFPTKNNFTIKAKTVAANASLCVRLRMEGTQNYEEYCQLIVISNISSRPDIQMALPQDTAPTLKLSKSLPQRVYTKEYRLQQSIIVATFIITAITLIALLVLFFRRRDSTSL